MNFERQPPTERIGREFALEVAATSLSGLLAEPSDPRLPRALIVAIHGAGMHAGYFNTATAPGLSLLELASQLGYVVWAPDRPGIGATADLPDERITLMGQAELLLDAIDQYRDTRPVGAGVLLVGHSYGLKVAWTMAAQPRGRRLLGIDGAASGVRYVFDWARTKRGRVKPRPAGDRGDSWGPESLYPKGTFNRGALPLHPVPIVQAAESAHWPDDLRSMAERIRVPLRVTYGEHERLWPVDKPHLDELQRLFTNAPRVVIEVEPFAGHNLSLGWSARSYHLKLLAFAEACLVSDRLT